VLDISTIFLVIISFDIIEYSSTSCQFITKQMRLK